MDRIELTSNEYTHYYQLTAGEAGAESAMPLTLLLQRVIEVSTEHANALNIGYANLAEHGIAWVLSKISFDMTRYPVINESYSITTWIEGYNRRFSDRCFMICDGEGQPIGYGRSVWTAIDIVRRCVGDLSALEKDALPVSPRLCPVARTPRIPELGHETTVGQYRFRYCDIDFNRHVNSVRYLAMILNHWSLDHFDNNMVSHIDIVYHHECYFGETVDLRVLTRAHQSDCEISRDGSRAVSLHIVWSPRLSPNL